MGVYFSKSLKGFIPENWKTDGTYNENNWPSDAVLLTQEESDLYWRMSPPKGMQLGSTDDGKPCWEDIPPISVEEMILISNMEKLALQREAEDIIKPLERAKILGIATQAELDLLVAWETYSVHLMRVETSIPEQIVWPEKPL